MLGICYMLLSIASVRLTRFDGGAAFIWLASSPLLVALLARPARQWGPPLLCCAAGSCVSTCLFGIGPWAALPLAAVLAGEAVLAAVLLRLVGAARAPLDEVPAFARFVAVACIVVPAISGVPASLIICGANGQPLLSAFVPWFAAHGLGFLILVPLMLLTQQGSVLSELRSLARGRALHMVGLTVALVAVCVVTFWQSRLPLLFLPMLPLVVSAFVMGRLGAAAAVVVLAGVGGAFTLTGHGPVALMVGTAGAKAQLFQFYLSVAVLIVLPVATDLRRREALFLRLQESEAGMRLLTANLGDVIIHTDREGIVRYASPSLETLSGIAPADLVGHPHEQLIVVEDHAAMQAARQAALADTGRTIMVEYRVTLPTGAVAWRETQLRGYQDSDGQPAGVVLVVRDATERKRQVEALELAARSDPLTGVRNRRAFFAALDAQIADAASSRACLAIFDIDHFKRVNDQFGHAVGDRVLRAVAAEAQRALRGSDLLARVGGEEFAVLLPEAALPDARAACERLRRRVEALAVDAAPGCTLAITVSIGLVHIEAGMTAAAAYEAADRALYEAKHGGRNQLKVAA